MCSNQKLSVENDRWAFCSSISWKCSSILIMSTMESTSSREKRMERLIAAHALHQNIVWQKNMAKMSTQMDFGFLILFRKATNQIKLKFNSFLGNNLGKGAHNILAIKSAFCNAYAILHNALIQLAQYPEQIIEHYYYGPLTSLIINTEFNNRSANIESSRLILFGQLMEGKQQPNEEEAKNTSDEANLIEEHGTTVEDDSISTINDGDGIINNDDVATKMKIE